MGAGNVSLGAGPAARTGNSLPDWARGICAGSACERVRKGIVSAGLGLAALALASAAFAETRVEEAAALDGLELSLGDAVAMALAANPRLASARLTRVLQEYDLKRAEEWFAPRVSSGSLSARRSLDAATGERSWDLAAGPRMDMRLPTGGAVSLAPGWTATAGPDRGLWNERLGVSLMLSQPLLRGGGFDTGRAPVRLASLAEDSNLLGLKAVVMDVVMAVTRAYRGLIGAQLQLDINRRSLARARETLTVNRLLVETGRMAEQDVTQTEADIAARELSVVESEMRLDDARRDLNVLLDLESVVRVVPTTELNAQPVAADIERSSALARDHRIDYLQALVDVRRSEIGLALARNGMLWDLSLDASATFPGTGDSPGGAVADLGGPGDGSYALGLSLSIPLGGDEGRSLRRQRLAAVLAMRQAKNALASATREMDAAVRNAVLAMHTGTRRMELARSALALAEETLEIEREKLKLGLSSNFRLAEYETDLLNAQVGELRARIDYLNAVTTHDRAVGTLLGTWGIDVERLPDAPGAGR